MISVDHMNITHEFMYKCDIKHTIQCTTEKESILELKQIIQETCVKKTIFAKQISQLLGKLPGVRSIIAYFI